MKALRKRIHFYESYLSFDPGHYYSPIVEPSEYLEQQSKATASERYLPIEIDFNEMEQLNLLNQFVKYYPEFPFLNDSKSLRFTINNVFFTFSDALALYNMLREKKPQRVVEIGSGFSSALMLDVNERFFNNGIEFTFIDPSPERLEANLKENERVFIIKEKVQDIDISVFKTLESGDFLMIDTSHVSKSGSDVNHIYFNILPNLNSGVIIHIHDIFFPFEYPEQWILKENRSWNELFLLRAYLAYNTNFKIIYFNSFLEKKYRQFFEDKMPLSLTKGSTICGGIWIDKI